jgi:hypothetical protein
MAPLCQRALTILFEFEGRRLQGSRFRTTVMPSTTKLRAPTGSSYLRSVLKTSHSRGMVDHRNGPASLLKQSWTTRCCDKSTTDIQNVKRYAKFGRPPGAVRQAVKKEKIKP